MKFGILAASVIGSGLLLAAPATAQIQFGIGPDGRPNVQVGPSQREIERERRREWRERRRFEETTGSTRRGYRVRNERCRTVTIEEEDDNGDTIVRRRQRCD